MSWINKPRDLHFDQALQTDRFELRPLSLWQAWRLGANNWLDDPELASAITAAPLRGSQWRLFRRMAKPNGRTRFTYGIFPHGSDHAIGVESVQLRNYRTAHLAVLIHNRDWWGKGVVVEVRGRVIPHLFESDRVGRIQGQVEGRNFASIFNYRKLGFDHVGTFHQCIWSTAEGAPADHLLFEMMEDNWHKRGAA
ncbi:MAG: GNAT family N-acetyltransferase [Rhodobacteraceae bacterium]|nr:GNAT family N-acetyltransferase [Paracoccaceae bacterium]